MKFDHQDAPVSIEDISGVESQLQLILPCDLKNKYLRANGGEPYPYVYEDDNLDTVVSKFFPILSVSNYSESAIGIYLYLIMEKKIVPSNYFPFAVDGGGDYFFVDCNTENGLVFFYQSDCFSNEEPLLCLNVGITEFFMRLKLE